MLKRKARQARHLSEVSGWALAKGQRLWARQVQHLSEVLNRALVCRKKKMEMKRKEKKEKEFSNVALDPSQSL